MNALHESYERAVSLWARLKSEYPKLSAPHLVEPWPEYAQCTTRLMIVGQETLGWGEDKDPNTPAPELVASLRQGYRDFDLGASYRSTPFWSAANQLFAAFNPNATRRSYIWSNLIKMDNDRRRPVDAIQSQITALGLLQAEIDEFTPDVVVFFTGPRYDTELLRTFDGATLRPLAKSISVVEHSRLPRNSFRTYHPKYLRLSKQWPVLDELVKYCNRTVALSLDERHDI